MQHTVKSSTFLLSHDLFVVLPSSGWGNVNDMRMVDVKYDEYALSHTIKTKDGVDTVVNKLYGKFIICICYTLSCECDHQLGPVMHTAAD